MKGDHEGEEGRQVSASWLYQSSHTQQSAQPQLSAESAQTAADEQTKPDPLKKFPFTFTPSSSTLTAWQQTRQRWANSTRRPGLAEAAPTEASSAS